jgi:hypothetical protein
LGRLIHAWIFMVSTTHFFDEPWLVILHQCSVYPF